MMSWLEELETELSNISALAHYSNDDEAAMLIRAHYTRIPLDKFRQLLTAFVIRDRLRKRLGLPTNDFPPTPSLSSQMETTLLIQSLSTAKLYPSVKMLRFCKDSSTTRFHIYPLNINIRWTI